MTERSGMSAIANSAADVYGQSRAWSIEWLNWPIWPRQTRLLALQSWLKESAYLATAGVIVRTGEHQWGAADNCAADTPSYHSFCHWLSTTGNALTRSADWKTNAIDKNRSDVESLTYVCAACIHAKWLLVLCVQLFHENEYHDSVRNDNQIRHSPLI